MEEVIIAGIGQTAVGEHWDLSLRSLASQAIQAARKDSCAPDPQAIYVGNLLAAEASQQANLGSLLASNSGLTGLEAYTIEAAGASGGGALRMGYLAVASGFVDVALVVGVEKCTNKPGAEIEALAAETMDSDFEGMSGLTLTSQAALLMRRYLEEYNLPHNALGAFPILAHTNAVNNPNAMYRRAVTQEIYDQAGLISPPLNMMDAAPYSDGAAAVVLARSSLLPKSKKQQLVRISGSSVVTDTLSPHDRTDLLAFTAAGLSVERACRQAGILPTDVDLFELSDAFSIYAALSLEAAGFAPRGESWKLAMEGQYGITGSLPISTMGGLKARGNPIGAAGIYQVVEAVQQLRGQAGKNQVSGAKRALVQSLGGACATAVTHVLEKWTQN
jgi:acetyl-CoA C-acetyltransferase